MIIDIRHEIRGSSLTERIFDEASKVIDGPFLLHDGRRYFRFDRVEVRANKAGELELEFRYDGKSVWTQCLDKVPEFANGDELHIEDINAVKGVVVG